MRRGDLDLVFVYLNKNFKPISSKACSNHTDKHAENLSLFNVEIFVYHKNSSE